MFDFVYKHKRLVQVILALITLPFAFFGVDYYFRGDRLGRRSGAPSAATRSRRRNSTTRCATSRSGCGSSSARISTRRCSTIPKCATRCSSSSISQRLLDEQGAHATASASPTRSSRSSSRSIPPFQEDGKFSPERYEQLLAAQGMTPLQFEQRVRQELMLAPLQEPIAGGQHRRQEQRRALSRAARAAARSRVAAIGAEPFVKDVKIDDAAVKAFYDANQAAFQTPEQAKIEYVLLTPDALAGAGQGRSRGGEAAIRREPRSSTRTAEERQAATS